VDVGEGSIIKRKVKVNKTHSSTNLNNFYDFRVYIEMYESRIIWLSNNFNALTKGYDHHLCR